MSITSLYFCSAGNLLSYPLWSLHMFLVGAFSFKEKSPTITVASFFSFFFVRPQSSSRMYHFLQKLISSLRLVRPMQTYCKGSPFRFLPFLRNLQNRKTPKGPRFQFFFGTVRIFFSKIFIFSKESPLRIFWYFATKSMLMNPKGSPLFIFRHYATFSKFFQKKFFKKNFSKKFSNFFCFQSSREKWFSSHIEHARHTLGVSKVFSKLFMNTSWAYLENSELFEP